MTLHASGGMGNVFVAKDEQLNRSVALKEIQERFADDRQIRERFLREAEVTGQLEHPGIVPVYALERHSDGRPYYVMRMIRGDSFQHAITALHRLRGDEHAFQLELRRLLNRFIIACNTIEYAHSRGVVHRDLKPDNILLGPYGETLVVDWGLAKIVGSSEVKVDVPASDDSAIRSRIDATQVGTVTGTPSFMSPEQALGWQDAIKPVTDIYSLGTTLYALLTGRPPVSGDNLVDLLVRIQRHDFPKPRELNPSVPRPLEAICLKAMAPTMNARYQTAALLAADLEAFLAGEPVAAWREPISVRAARWVRRHRTLVSTAAASATVVLLALAVIVVLQETHNRNLSAANNREKSARQEAESERDKAQQNFQMAQDAVDRYFTQVSEDRRLAAHGLEPLRRDLLTSAGQFYERFLAEDTRKAALHYDNAWAKFRIASMTSEIASPVEAAAKFEQAAKRFREMIQIEGGSSPRSREGILMCEINLSGLYDRMGQRDKAQASLADALQIARSLVKEYPQLAAGKNLLAHCLGIRGSFALEQGNLSEARAAYGDELQVREALVQLQPKQQSYQVELAGACRNLAVVEQRSERLDEARRLVDKTLDIDRRLVRENPDDAFLQNILADALTHSGDLAARAGRGDDAQRAYHQAVDLRAALVKRHPDVLEYRAALATTADNLGVFCSELGQFETAQNSYRQAIIQSERLATDYPDEPAYQSTFATVLVNAAMLWTGRGLTAPAEQLLNRAYQIREKLRQHSPKDAERDEEFASACLALAIVETDLKHADRAEKHLSSAIDIFRQLTAGHSDRPLYAERLGACFKQLGDLYKSRQRDDDAVAAYKNALERQRQLIATHPAVLKHRVDLAETCINLGNLWTRRGQSASAASAFDEAIRSFPEPSRASLVANARSALEKGYTGRAFARESQGDVRGMADDMEKAIALASTARARILRLMCATALLGSNETERAIAMSEPLVGDRGLDGGSAFGLAQSCMAAASSKVPASKEHERLVELGLRFLERARDSGYFAVAANRAKLQSSPFVPLLSSNSGYRRLLDTIQEQPGFKDAVRSK